MLDLMFYKGKRVLITGHTGFKGTWLTKILVNAGANVIGYSRCSGKMPGLFGLSGLESRIIHIAGDIRDLEHLKRVFEEYQPEIVFHLAAQPIVKEGYNNPACTFEINVMGTVNVMECVRNYSCVKSVLNVTSDKVYYNNEWYWGYREEETLNGFEPYSNSKSCSELVTCSYKNSFFSDGRVAVSTARAGNVIGGGDFADERIIPDCVKAMRNEEVISVRNPYSIRPYQHVLEALALYLEIVEKQYKDIKYADCYNVGPDDCDCVTTGELVDLFCQKWGKNASWEKRTVSHKLHEADFLKLDCSKVKSVFGWRPRWHIDKSVEMVCRFSKVWLSDGDISTEMDLEIDCFFGK